MVKSKKRVEKIFNKALHNFYSELKVIGVIKSRNIKIGGTCTAHAV